MILLYSCASVSELPWAGIGLETFILDNYSVTFCQIIGLEVKNYVRKTNFADLPMNDLVVWCANQSKNYTLCSYNKYNYITCIYAYLL